VLLDESFTRETQMLDLMLERTVNETDCERRKENGISLAGVCLLIANKERERGYEGAERIVKLIERIDDMLFLKKDRERAPPASSSASSSLSGSPHLLLVDLITQLNAFLFASPVFVKRDQRDVRVLLPVSMLRRAMVNAAQTDDETKHQQFQLLSSSALHATRLLLADDPQSKKERESDSDVAQYVRRCFEFVLEYTPLAIVVR